MRSGPKGQANLLMHYYGKYVQTPEESSHLEIHTRSALQTMHRKLLMLDPTIKKINIWPLPLEHKAEL